MVARDLTRSRTMDTEALLRLRLHNQQLTDPRARTPQTVVSAMVAMQAQEYAMSKWAIALRMKGASCDADIERAFDAGKILRTHVMRPTWHFVAPADIRWLLALTAPRVHAASAYMYRKLGLTPALVKRSTVGIVRALEAEGFLTRVALQAALAGSGVRAAGETLAYLVMHAELEGLICSGPRQGRQFTYALLDARAPGAKSMSRDAALAELSRRYFTSRGPASAQDFAMWSGLTLTDARAGIETLDRGFEQETIGARTYVFRPARSAPESVAGFAFLMPDYDEYGMSYQDRSALFPGTGARKSRDVTLAYNRMIVVDGRIVGSWRRSLVGASVKLETDYFVTLSRARAKAVSLAIRRFTDFAGREVDDEPRRVRTRARSSPTGSTTRTRRTAATRPQ